MTLRTAFTLLKCIELTENYKPQSLQDEVTFCLCFLYKNVQMNKLPYVGNI